MRNPMLVMAPRLSWLADEPRASVHVSPAGDPDEEDDDSWDEDEDGEDDDEEDEEEEDEEPEWYVAPFA